MSTLTSTTEEQIFLTKREETYTQKFNITTLSTHLDFLKKHGLTEYTAEDILRGFNTSDDQKINSKHHKTIKAELALYKESMQDNVTDNNKSIMMKRLANNQAGFFWKTLFKGLSQVFLGVFGFARLHHIHKTVTIHTKIDGLFPYNQSKTLSMAASWTKDILPFFMWAKGMEIISGFGLSRTRIEKDQVKNLTTTQKIGYYAGGAVKLVMNLAYFFAALELFEMLAKSASAIAGLAHHTFNISGKVSQLKGILLSKLGTYFKPVTVLAKIFGAAFIAATAISTLRGVWKFGKAVYNHVYNKTAETKQTLLKTGIKGLLKGVGLAGTILLVSTPIIGWAMLAASSTLLGVWTLSKIWRKKSSEYINQSKLIQKVEIKPVIHLNSMKELLRNEFIRKYKAALKRSPDHPRIAAKNALQYLHQQIDNFNKKEEIKDTPDAHLTEWDTNHLKAYAQRLYFQAQKISSREMAKNIKDTATPEADKLKNAETARVTTKNLANQETVDRLKRLQTSIAINDIEPEKPNPAKWEQPQTQASLATAFLEATQKVMPTAGAGASAGIAAA